MFFPRKTFCLKAAETLDFSVIFDTDCCDACSSKQGFSNMTSRRKKKVWCVSCDSALWRGGSKNEPAKGMERWLYLTISGKVSWTSVVRRRELHTNLFSFTKESWLRPLNYLNAAEKTLELDEHFTPWIFIVHLIREAGSFRWQWTDSPDVVCAGQSLICMMLMVKQQQQQHHLFDQTPAITRWVTPAGGVDEENGRQHAGTGQKQSLSVPVTSYC